jgi:hypothetical protein
MLFGGLLLLLLLSTAWIDAASLGEKGAKEEEENYEDEKIPAIATAPDSIRQLDEGINSSGRLLTLSILPYLSGSCDQQGDNAPLVWGYFFDNSVDQRYGRDQFTLQALSQPDHDARQQAAAQAAIQWLLTHQRELFRTIFLVEYQPLLAEAVSMVRVDPSHHANRIHIILQERRPITTAELVQLRDNVITGGDTWDGGDFGSFAMRDGECQLRLTLCSDPTTDWVDLPSSLWPPSTRRTNDVCKRSLYNTSPQYSDVPQSGLQILIKAFIDWWWPPAEVVQVEGGNIES